MAKTLVVLVLLLGLGFAGLSRYPQARWVERAEEWPLVGALATWFRRAYIPTEPVQSGAEPQISEMREVEAPPKRRAAERVASVRRTAEQSAPVLRLEALAPSLDPGLERQISKPAPIRPAPVRRTDVRPTPVPRRDTIDDSQVIDWTWLLPGTPLAEQPHTRSTSRPRLSSLARLPVLSRQSEWVEVLYRRDRVWVEAQWRPEYPEEGAKPRRHHPIRDNDKSRIRRAAKIMSLGDVQRMIGPYRLYTDVENDELLSFLDDAVGYAEDSYFARYGRRPSGEPKRAMILFASESDYQKYEEEVRSAGQRGGSRRRNTELTRMRTGGHAASGVVALFAEGRTRQGLAESLLHETGHLLNTRALGARFAPWLEEGLASGLGTLWIEDVGRPRVIHVRRMDAALAILQKRLEAGDLPSLEVLMGLPRETFYSARYSRFTYPHSALLVEYLLVGGHGRFADRFRRYLKLIAYGRDPATRLLLAELAIDIEALDAGFRDWLGSQTHQLSGR